MPTRAKTWRLFLYWAPLFPVCQIDKTNQGSRAVRYCLSSGGKAMCWYGCWLTEVSAAPSRAPAVIWALERRTQEFRASLDWCSGDHCTYSHWVRKGWWAFIVPFGQVATSLLKESKKLFLSKSSFPRTGSSWRRTGKGPLELQLPGMGNRWCSSK